jgi:hypothetical protein
MMNRAWSLRAAIVASLHRAHRLALLHNVNSHADLFQPFAEVAHTPVTSRHDVSPKGRFQLLQRTLDELLRVRNHWQPQLVGTTRTPKAIRNGGKPGIQTNGYWFDGPNHDGKTVEMWASIPPASQLRFNDDGSVTFYPDTDRSWTLEFTAPGNGIIYQPPAKIIAESRDYA